MFCVSFLHYNKCNIIPVINDDSTIAMGLATAVQSKLILLINYYYFHN